ncbi:clan AA aspartic protease [Tamlana fucoidanivorans]|uniref:PDZ domain-containing protein n=1 Tax=Allotamlana fucoidanivorans TaxID=2583814 RepID=A0A5C4SDS0_9FLAO|nr:retropepsin-like aspartic protease [Tamlana fucoidanivorans]TNJ41706.1 hypothetical protein FGF67_15600 [Tamlana fucoidanivorans]
MQKKKSIKALSILLLGCMIFMNNTIEAQQNRFTKGLRSDKNYYTEIHFDFISEKIIIPVTIENRTYKFMLDTGAPNVISKELSVKIESKSISQINVSDATNKRNQLELVSIPELQLGSIRFINCPTLVDNTSHNLIFDCFDIDGIIGSNMLYKSIIQINLDNKLLVVTDTPKRLHLNKDEAFKMDLINAQKSPYIWIEFKGDKTVKEHVLIDTGMKGFYDLTLNHMNKLSDYGIYTKVSEATGSASMSLFGTAKQNTQYRLIIDQLKFVNTVFNNTLVKTTNDTNSRIGAEMLKYGTMTFNFKQKRFYFNPHNRVVDMKQKHLGFSPSILGNKIIVGIVWSADLKEQLEYGDEIITVDDLDVQSTPLCDFINGSAQVMHNDTFSMVVKKANGALKTVLIKKSYFKGE